MERVRSGYEVDSAVVLAQMMTLREVALSFEAGIQKLEQSGFSAPPAASVSQFKSSVLAKVSCLQRYLSERTSWHEDLRRSRACSAIFRNARHGMKIWNAFTA